MYVYSGILLSLRKENPVVYCILDEPRGHYVKRNKLCVKRQTG